MRRSTAGRWETWSSVFEAMAWSEYRFARQRFGSADGASASSL